MPLKNRKIINGICRSQQFSFIENSEERVKAQEQGNNKTVEGEINL